MALFTIYFSTMRKTYWSLMTAALLGVATLFTCNAFRMDKTLQRPMPSTANDSTPSSFFQFTVNGLDGKPVALEQFRGRKIIVLNTASECGYTPQYADWEKFYAANKEHIVVLGFPCVTVRASTPTLFSSKKAIIDGFY